MDAEYLIKISFINVFLFILLKKFKVIEYYQLNKPKNWPECTFCFYWWVSFIEIAFGNISHPVVSFSTGIDLLVMIDVVVDAMCVTVASCYLWASISKL